MGADGIVAPKVVGAFERGGTFRLNDSYSFRVPTRGFWTSDIDQHTREIWVFGPTSWVRVEPYTGRERERWVNEEDAHPSQTHATLDGIVESIRYAPVIPPLLAATGGTWGEVVLQWANSTDATGWQYRQRKYDNSQWEEWSAWVDVPNCGPADCGLTLTGLVPGSATTSKCVLDPREGVAIRWERFGMRTGSIQLASPGQAASSLPATPSASGTI